MRRRLLRRPALLALMVAIVSFGLLSSSIGEGALPATSLPPFGLTTGNGSLSTVAELGDVNGDHINDYAVGLPSADVAGSADAGIVYVFLGHGGQLPASPTAIDLGDAAFTISGHASEMLGYSIAGADVNGDGINDIAIGAPMASAPSNIHSGAVYVVLGSLDPTPSSVTTSAMYADDRLTNDAMDPAPPSALGSRYDGISADAHTGMSLTALPDLNGDGREELAVGAPDSTIHTTHGGFTAVLWGQQLGVHISLKDIWGAGYPYYFHIDWPSLAESFTGVSVASVGDMTGDGFPDLAIGAPHADYNGRIDSGSVWIINGHRQDIGEPACYTMTPPATCHLPWIKLQALQAGEGYRIDGAAAGDQLGSSLAGLNGELAIGAAGASPIGRPGAGEVVVVAGQSGQATRDLAVTPPLQTIYGPEAHAGLGASLATAGVIGGSSTVLAGAPGEASNAGAAYLVQIAPGTTSDLALAPSKIAPAGAGSMTGSTLAAGLALDGDGGADALVAAPGVAGGAGAWYIVGGSGTPVLPPAPAPPAPPAPPTPPPAPPTPPPAPPTPPAPPATPPVPPVTTGGGSTGTTTTGGSTATSATEGTVTQAPSTTAKPSTGAKPVVKQKKKAKLPLCPVKKPKPKYHMVKGKRVKVKPKPCRPRAKKTTVKSS